MTQYRRWDRLLRTIVGLDLADITDMLTRDRGSTHPLTQSGVITVPFTYTMHHVNNAAMRLDVVGEVRGPKVSLLAITILDSIIVDLRDEIVIDLDAARFLDPIGVWALVCGYRAAAECGTTYRAVNAHDQVHRVLHAAGVLEILADSEDIGALVLALLTLPGPISGGRLGRASF